MGPSSQSQVLLRTTTTTTTTAKRRKKFTTVTITNSRCSVAFKGPASKQSPSSSLLLRCMKKERRLLLNYVKLAHVTTFLHRPSLLDLAPPTNQLLKITILLFGFSSCHLTGKKNFRQMADQRENHMFLREINFMH